MHNRLTAFVLLREMGRMVYFNLTPSAQQCGTTVDFKSTDSSSS